MNAFAPLNEDELARAQQMRPADPWRPILPVPDDAPPLTRPTIDRFAPEGHAFTTEWRYLHSSGQLMGCVVRYERPAKGNEASKQVKPFSYCEGPDGRHEWRCKAFPEPRPLYGLDQLAARPDAPVLVVEGEKAADAVAKRFPDYVAVTSPGGCKVTGKADWSPLSGRLVVIWPDADDAGKAYANDVVDVLRKVGAGSVSVADVASVAGLPQGWDLADDLPAGFTEGDLAKTLAEANSAETDGPLPLFPSMPKAERYPIEALGPVLSQAAAAISRKVQVPEAIAGQSVLAATALCTQAHADVMLLYGQS